MAALKQKHQPQQLWKARPKIMQAMELPQMGCASRMMVQRLVLVWGLALRCCCLLYFSGLDVRAGNHACMRFQKEMMSGKYQE
eukprot:1159410-Pelagomonas_calceolata.AAC.1